MDPVTLGIAILKAKKMVQEVFGLEPKECTSATDTPYGVTFVKDGVTITGTLVASADTLHKIYLVPRENGTGNYFDEYITFHNETLDTYYWEKFGSTEFVQQTLVCHAVDHVMRISLE